MPVLRNAVPVFFTFLVKFGYDTCNPGPFWFIRCSPVIVNEKYRPSVCRDRRWLRSRLLLRCCLDLSELVGGRRGRRTGRGGTHLSEQESCRPAGRDRAKGKHADDDTRPRADLGAGVREFHELDPYRRCDRHRWRSDRRCELGCDGSVSRPGRASTGRGDPGERFNVKHPEERCLTNKARCAMVATDCYRRNPRLYRLF
jgi:hypothetical protein